MATSLEKYLTLARNAGCQPEQVRNFRLAEYASLPWALHFHAAARQADQDSGPFWIGVGGARGPGKSHALMAQTGADDCQRFEGLRFLFLRKIQKAAKESFEDLTRRTLRNLDVEYADGIVRFGNGSSIVVGGYKDQNDIEKYLGLQYDGADIEEMTQLSEDKVTKVRGSIRSSVPGWRPRIYNSTNPGGVGHLFYRKNFVEPHIKGAEHLLVGGRTMFFPATYKDNPFLDNEYVSYLKALKGPLGKAWREGDFYAFEGMGFPDWDEEIHVCDPFEIPDSWPKWRAIDWGFAKPFICGWFTKDVDTGRVYVFFEYSSTMLTDRQQARMVNEYTPAGMRISETFADPSMWARKNVDDKVTTTYDEYKAEGVVLSKADNDRINGKRKIHRLLGIQQDGKPGLMVFRNCTYLIEVMGSIPSDPNNPEDIDTKADDHPVDMLKYGLTRYEREKEPQARKPKSRAEQDLENWFSQGRGK